MLNKVYNLNMLAWILAFLNTPSFGIYATNNGYAFSTSFKVIQKKNYTLNLGFTNYSYMGLRRNFLNMDFRMKWNNLEIRVIGNIPIDTKKFPR